MRIPLIISFSTSMFLFSCGNSTTKKVETTVKPHLAPSQEVYSNTPPKNIKPAFGYRFILSGDFDGDGKKERLVEHFFSGLNNKETNKFYANLSEYDQLVTLTLKKSPYSFVTSDNELIDTLRIDSEGQLFGLSYLKNEGDLTGDGREEVSYVVNWADWSNLNTCHLVTYKNKRWVELYSFPIWDWQLPDLPETFNQYGLFGLQQKLINSTNDTVNARIEKELIAFKGLIKKVKKNKIQVVVRNDEAELDTMVVDLKAGLNQTLKSQ